MPIELPDEIRRLVGDERWKQFQQFVETGVADEAFLDELDRDESLQRAADAALSQQAEQFSHLVTLADSSLPAGAKPAAHSISAFSKSIITIAGLALVVAAGYFGLRNWQPGSNQLTATRNSNVELALANLDLERELRSTAEERNEVRARLDRLMRAGSPDLKELREELRLSQAAREQVEAKLAAVTSDRDATRISLEATEKQLASARGERDDAIVARKAIQNQAAKSKSELEAMRIEARNAIASANKIKAEAVATNVELAKRIQAMGAAGSQVDDAASFRAMSAFFMPVFSSNSTASAVDTAIVTAGSPRRGKELFAGGKELNCATCHKDEDGDETLGPRLHELAAKRSATDLVHSLLSPHAEAAKKYAVTQIETTSGQVLKGRVVDDTDGVVTLAIFRNGKIEQLRIEKSTIAEQKETRESWMSMVMSHHPPLNDAFDLASYISEMRRPPRRRGAFPVKNGVIPAFRNPDNQASPAEK